MFTWRFFMHQESCPCHIFSLHYQGNFSMEIKRDVGVFLKTKCNLAGKIVPNDVCLCLSTKQKSPVVTLKNFQKCAKIEGTFSHGVLQLWLKWGFFFQLEANKCCYGCCHAQANKQVMLNEPIRSKITTNRDLFAHVCPCFTSPTCIFLTVSSCCD